MIKNRLKEILYETRTSQRQLARAIGRRTNTISDIANNKLTRYDMQIIEEICNYFPLSIEQFFYIDEEPRPEETRGKSFT